MRKERGAATRPASQLSRQRGQAAFVAIVFVLLSMLALYTGFNTLQLGNAKIKLTNTADAVAYSAAVMQARDYNFSAYANRAMVANQLTVAQLLSLRAWIDALTAAYMPDHPIDTVVQEWAQSPETWMEPKAMAEGTLVDANVVIESIASTGVKGVDIVNYALSSSSSLYHVSTVLSMPLLADQIARDNEADSYVDNGYFAGRGLGTIAAWIIYTQNEKNTPDQIRETSALTAKINSAMQKLSAANQILSSQFVLPGSTYVPDTGRFASVVTDPQTTDSFVTSRNSALMPFVASALTQVGCPDGGGVFFLTLAHTGGTNLQSDGWQALDATQANGFSICVVEGVPIPFYYYEDQGNGGAANGDGSTYTFFADDSALQNIPGPGHLPGGIPEPGMGNLNLFGGALYDPLVLLSGWDRLVVGPGPSLDGPYTPAWEKEPAGTEPGAGPNRAGLLSYQDIFGLKNPSGGQDDSFNRCPALTFEVSRTAQSVASASTMLGPQPGAASGAPNGVMRALSSADCYFIRPNESQGAAPAGRLPAGAGWTRADGEAEYPSLFNPYWQSSLVATPAAVSAAARQALVSGAQ